MSQNVPDAVLRIARGVVLASRRTSSAVKLEEVAAAEIAEDVCPLVDLLRAFVIAEEDRCIRFGHSTTAHARLLSARALLASWTVKEESNA